MKAIIVDDEPLMIKKFVRTCSKIRDLEIVGQFEEADEAVRYARDHSVEIAFIDISMPVKNGITLAEELREIRSDIIIVFVSAYDNYLHESNRIGGDYYIVKPYTAETLNIMMERVRLLAGRQKKDIFVRTFGRFTVFKNSKPIPLTGKAKEILALVVTKRGKEISNEQIYNTVWEGRPNGNKYMSVYYNALRRLKQSLANAGIENILVSTLHGKLIDTDLIECDYYAWQDKKTDSKDQFEGEFMSEYSWGETILAEMLNETWKYY